MDTYYNPADFAKFGTMGEEAPELWESFMQYYGAVFAEGALTAREKSLIALAVAHRYSAHTVLILIRRIVCLKG